MATLKFPITKAFLNDVFPDQATDASELRTLASQFLDGDFSGALACPTARILSGHEDDHSTEEIRFSGDEDDYSQYIRRRLHALLSCSPSSSDPNGGSRIRIQLLYCGLAALHAFLQSNVSGPPLSWNVRASILPVSVLERPGALRRVRQHMLQSLTVDGTAVYALTPDVELFWLAKVILCDPLMMEMGGDDFTWARLRVNYWHQKMLSENAATLQDCLFRDLETLGRSILGNNQRYGTEVRVQFLLERAGINLHHGFDAKAREDLTIAASETGFQFALTGRLGKRTKFQEKELSQLVVLAASADEPEPGMNLSTIHPTLSNGNGSLPHSPTESRTKPQNLTLNDDTLLDSISFSNREVSTLTNVQNEETLPPKLITLDPSNQPLLKPLDSIILLSMASAITNTSPQHGLTREETLPYATRVLEGGSNNWQIYTQALLVRSRIEGYKSRTVERGVLQLQALVDQVIAETTSTSTSETGQASSGQAQPATTFLPRATSVESAPASERLQYIHQLGSPTRWELEAELAARWVSLGGLRTALEIYERLQMWAEAALCWAATDREDKARTIVRRQLYQSIKSEKIEDSISDPDEEDGWQGPERDDLPNDAPRLFCILGDIDKDPSMYERAWAVSRHRYARAQRSLGRYYYSAKDHRRAEEAYATSLTVNRLDHPTWFALGCVRLELEDWQGAVEAFSRTVQLDDQDAEAWSNLAAALLRLPPSSSQPDSAPATFSSDEDQATPPPNPQRHRLDALAALKRASSLPQTLVRIHQLHRRIDHLLPRLRLVKADIPARPR